MIITHETPTYAKGRNEPATLRNVSKTNAVIRINKERENIEQQMMSFAYKVGRSDKQREERRGKR